jgi:hypothetical protein
VGAYVRGSSPHRHAGVGLVQFDETVGPEAHHEAKAIIAGIHKLHDRLRRQNN